MIAGATSATYKPVLDNGNDDAVLKSDVGRYLLAVVSYTDAKQNVDDEGDGSRDGQGHCRVGLGQSGGRGHEEQSAGVRRPGFRHPWHAEPVRDERGGGDNTKAKGNVGRR